MKPDPDGDYIGFEDYSSVVAELSKHREDGLINNALMLEGSQKIDELNYDLKAERTHHEACLAAYAKCSDFIKQLVLIAHRKDLSDEEMAVCAAAWAMVYNPEKIS